MTPHRPPPHTIALFVTRSVVASVFLGVVATTTACGRAPGGEDDSPPPIPAPTSVRLNFTEDQVSITSSPTLTGPDGAAKTVTWGLSVAGTHALEPADGEPKGRLSLRANIRGSLETYSLHTTFDITSVPGPLSPSHAASAYDLGEPEPGEIVTSFSGTALSTTGPATEFESSGVTGTTSVEEYSVSGTTEADAKITASMKFGELTLQTDEGDLVVDGTLSFSGAKEGSGPPPGPPGPPGGTVCDIPADSGAMCEAACPGTKQTCVIKFDADCGGLYECEDLVSDLVCDRYEIIEPGSTAECSYECDGSGRIRDIETGYTWTARPAWIAVVGLNDSKLSDMEQACAALGMRLPTLTEVQSVFGPSGYCETAFPMWAVYAFTSTSYPDPYKDGLYDYSCYRQGAEDKSVQCVGRVGVHCLK